MTVADKIKANNLRIAALKSRGETMNMRLIRKLERKNRILEAKL